MNGLLAKLLVKLGLDSKEFEQGINKSKKSSDKFGAAIKKVGGLIAGAFAVQRLISFGKELLNIGGIAEGVRAAFNRIANDDILNDLKEATKGTVSELELMKRTVQASNFGLPVEKLAELFKFATKRAQETGGSVDYLVNSIVLGISRKSIPILDNLGISSTQLREKLGAAGVAGATSFELMNAVSEIANDYMKEAGEIIDTNATKLQSLTARWADFKMQIAESPGFNKVISNELDEVSDNMEVFFSESISGWRKLVLLFDFTGKYISGYANDLRKAKKEQEDLRKEIDNYADELWGVDEVVTKVAQSFEEWDKAGEKIKKQTELVELLNNSLEKAEKFLSRDINMDAFGKNKTGDNAQFQKTMGFVLGIGFKDEEEEDTDAVVKAWEKTKADFAAFKQDMAYMVEDFSIEVVDQFGMAMGELLKTGDFPADFGKNILAIIGGFISQLGKMLIGLGVAATGFQALLESAFTSPPAAALAIAAGFALVALGGAIKGFAKAGPTGSSSSSVQGSSGYSVTSQPYKTMDKENSFYGVLKGDSIFLSNQRNTYKRTVIG